MQCTMTCAGVYAAAAVVLLSGASLPAATYYLATNGDDTNPGSAASPWGTFPYAANHLKPGDTLLVRQGTYSWIGLCNISSGASWEQPVTIKTYPKETVTFQKEGSPKAGMFISLGNDRQYVIIEGAFVFDGVGIGLNAARFIRLKDLEVKNGRSTAAIGGGDDCEFINLNVHHNGKGGLDHGIYSHGDRHLIDGGQWHHNSGESNIARIANDRKSGESKHDQSHENEPINSHSPPTS